MNDHTTIPTKCCTKCGDPYPETSEYFYRQKGGKNGLRSICKPCCKASKRLYYEMYPEKNREHVARWRANNPERSREIATKSYYKNVEEKRKRRREYRNKNKDYFNAYQMARYYERHEEKKEEKRRDYQKHHRKNLERAREYRRSEAGKRVEKNRYRNRRAREMNAPGRVTRSDIQMQMKAQNGRCWWCGCVLEKYHVDHRIPLSRGGTNYPDNIVLACPHCNTSKNARLPQEWAWRLL